MNAKLLLPALLAMAVLPSCAHPVNQVLNARNAAREAQLETTGSVAQGACDDLGQYIAHNRNTEQLSLRTDVHPSEAYVMVR